ncbi:hypothetical protein [Pedobacter sp. ASV28]|uniref:hypothetical protein n=1 Tax=Pedobacter sp. ASV28 TaxID=2795123 RepID=UPI0018EA4250|nr:hypothetical protein [Pedobacter sp. ASV28]
MMALGFIMVACLCGLFFYWGTNRQNNGFFAYVIWTMMIALLSYYGFFQQTVQVPPRILLVMIPAIIFVVYVYKRTDVRLLKLNLLMAIHVLRIPVELTLFQLFLEAKVPIIMTFKGWNYDILIGISAAVMLIWSIFSKRKINNMILRVWNIIGLFFLTVIVGMAILSAPSPVQSLAFGQPNLAIMQFPYTLLPAIIVPIVLLSHLLILKKISWSK